MAQSVKPGSDLSDDPHRHEVLHHHKLPLYETSAENDSPKSMQELRLVNDRIAKSRVDKNSARRKTQLWLRTTVTRPSPNSTSHENAKKQGTLRHYKTSAQREKALAAQVNASATLKHPLLSPPRPRPQGRLTVALINPQGNFTAGYKGINTHPDMGGQIIYVGEVAKALARQGVNAVVATRSFHDKRIAEFNQRYELLLEANNARACIVRMSGGRSGSIIRKEDLWPILDTWARQLAVHWTVNGEMIPHALTSHYGDGGFAATRLEKYLGVPHATFTAHSLGAQKLDSIQRGGSQGGTDRLACLNIPQRLAAERLSMQTARRIIVSTGIERTEQYAHPLYADAVDWQDSTRFAVVPPGVDVGIFGPDADTNDTETIDLLQVAMERDVAEGRRYLPVIVVAGRLVSKKNHVRTAQAFAESVELRSRSNLLLLLPGGVDALRVPQQVFSVHSEEFAVANQIRDIIQNHHLEGQFIAPGLDNTQEQLAAIYRYFSRSSQRGVLSAPSLFEPFGLLPLEAAMAGLPAVVGDRGGTVESLREKLPGKERRDCAVFVDPYSTHDISRGLLLVISSARKWREVQNAGRERVMSKYTWESAAKGYVNIIKATLATE